MKSLLLVLALQFCFISPAYADENATGEAVKTTISSLKKNVDNLSQGVNRLKKDKANIEQSLRDMEQWGNSEQEAKELYFNQSVQLGKDISEAHKTIEEDKKRLAELRESYQHVKSILGYVAGAFALLLYLRIGASIAMPFAGPYSVLLTFLGPAGAFAAGYYFVKLMF